MELGYGQKPKEFTGPTGKPVAGCFRKVIAGSAGHWSAGSLMRIQCFRMSESYVFVIPSLCKHSEQGIDKKIHIQKCGL